MVVFNQRKGFLFLFAAAFLPAWSIFPLSAQQHGFLEEKETLLHEEQREIPSAAGVSDSLDFAVLHFRVNSSLLDRDYMDNAATLEVIRRTFSDKRVIAEMDFISITATSSPEGNTSMNERLALERALSVKSYLMWKYPFMDRERIYTYSGGENWTGLRKMVYESDAWKYRTEVLMIIDSYSDGQSKWAAIRNLDNGVAYRFISTYMLPLLRSAATCTITYKEDPQTVVVTRTQTLTQTDTVYVDREVEKYIEIPIASESVSKRTPYYFAVKTNLLYDLALLPDLALEFSLPERWSIEVGGQLSWWNTPTTHKYCWRIQSVGLEFRKWLGNESRTSLTGHYVGLYGMAGTYDIRFNDKTGYLSDLSYSTGISYGYSLPVGKRCNLELGIAVGYLGGKYKTYSAYSEYYDVFPKESEKRLRYFGPTKAKIAFVWLLGSGTNERTKK